MNVTNLLTWSKKEFSHLPWRKKRSLYTTLVSEIMLQQTTVGTVKNHFDRFIETYPDLRSLASSTEEELLIAWKGLGYYRRAKNLKKIADVIVSEYGGEFPNNREQLQQISGIGPYTSSALISIGMDHRDLAVDANLERVIARLYGIKLEKGIKLQKEIYKLFESREILEFKETSYRELNEALMDLGRTYCQARKASCELCPLSKSCFAFQKKSPLKFPIETLKKKKEDHELQLLRCFIRRGDELLVYKKNDSEWLSGQYEVPTFLIQSTDEKLRQYPDLKKKLNLDGVETIKTGITKYKIKNFLMKMTAQEFKKFQFERDVTWMKIKSKDSNFSTTVLKGLKILGD